MQLELVTPPASEPVTTQEAKDHARISTSADDTLVSALIVTARHAAEAYLGRSIIAQTWRMWLDGWPASAGEQWWDGIREGAISELYGYEVRLPLGPAASVTHIKTYDDADAATVLSSSLYFVDLPGARIRLRSGASWPAPGRRANGIEIQWVSGWANAAAVPEPVKTGVKAHVAQLYEHRGDSERLAPKGSNVGTGDVAIPSVSEVLYQRYRMATL